MLVLHKSIMCHFKKIAELLLICNAFIDFSITVPKDKLFNLAPLAIKIGIEIDHCQY